MFAFLAAAGFALVLVDVEDFLGPGFAFVAVLVLVAVFVVLGLVAVLVFVVAVF